MKREDIIRKLIFHGALTGFAIIGALAVPVSLVTMCTGCGIVNLAYEGAEVINDKIIGAGKNK